MDWSAPLNDPQKNQYLVILSMEQPTEDMAIFLMVSVIGLEHLVQMAISIEDLFAWNGLNTMQGFA